MLLLLVSTAFGQGYQPPNSTVGAGIGLPWLVSVRGEAWFADEGSFQLGVGTLGQIEQRLGLDWALRWRPDFACVGCDGRVLGTFGAGVGGTVASDIDLAGGSAFDDAWGFAAGPDLAGTFTYWMTNTAGLMATGNGGVGAAWAG